MPDPLSLSVRDAAQEIAAGRLTAEALAVACLDRIAAREAVGRRLALSRPRRGARRGAAARRRAAARAAARHPDRGQGSDRHRRHADRLRLADL